jgi:hypothetical protein
MACETCDRAECPYIPYAAMGCDEYDAVDGDLTYAAVEDCRAHVHDWRAEALALRGQVAALMGERDAACADFARVNDETLAFLRGDVRYREMAETLRLRIGLPVPGLGYVHGPIQPSSAERLAELTAERDEARETSDYLTRQNLALLRELERHRHGTTIEGDVVCPDSLTLAEARRRIAELEARAVALEGGLAIALSNLRSARIADRHRSPLAIAADKEQEARLRALPNPTAPKEPT